jgi:hypothetical protein
VSSLFVAAFCSSVAAQQLPKSGSISVHSGYWAVGESVNVGEKTVQGHGNNRGIAFNDKGSGPLHLGPTDCFYTFSTIADHTKVKGYCTFSELESNALATIKCRADAVKQPLGSILRDSGDKSTLSAWPANIGIRRCGPVRRYVCHLCRRKDAHSAAERRVLDRGVIAAAMGAER